MEKGPARVEVLEESTNRPIRHLVTGNSRHDAILKSFDVLKERGFFETLRRGSLLPDEPPLYGYRTEVGAGVSFFDETQALLRTLGETLERGLWERRWQEKTKNVSYQKLHRLFNLKNLAGFSIEQQEAFLSEVIRTNPDIACVHGYTHTRNRRCLVPLQLVNKDHFVSAVAKNRNEPRLRTAITTGLATGKSPEESQLKGFLEVIERDAFMVSFLNSLTLPRIHLAHLAKQYPELAVVHELCERYKLELSFIRLLTDAPVHVYTAIITDRTKKGPAVAVGAKASFSLVETLLGAAAEAMAVRFMHKNSFEEVEKTPCTQFGRLERLKWWSNIDQLPKIQDFISGPFESPYNVPPINSAVEGLARIRMYCKKNSYQMISVPYRYPVSQKLTLYVSYCLIPEMHPLYLNECYPAKSSVRLSSMPKQFGYEGKENLTPHPFP